MAKGYTIRIIESRQLLNSWNAIVRRKGWRKGYWVTVTGRLGAVEYQTQDAAQTGAIEWIKQNESMGCAM